MVIALIVVGYLVGWYLAMFVTLRWGEDWLPCHDAGDVVLMGFLMLVFWSVYLAIAIAGSTLWLVTRPLHRMASQ